MSYYYPSQLSPRDNYLAALARAKEAEEEYLAAEAIEQEERQIRRRLEELQFQRQRASQPLHGIQDRLSLLRLQLQEEERRHAEAELFRRRNFYGQTPSAAFRFDQNRRECTQMARLQQRQRSTNHTSSGEPLGYTRIPTFRPRYRASPSRHIHPAVEYPPHPPAETPSSSSNAGFQELLYALSGGKPSSSARHYGPRTPTKAERKPVVQSVDTAAVIEQTLKAILSRANVEFHDQPKTVPTAPKLAPAASCSQRSSPSTAPVVQESASRPCPSEDAAVDLQQVLKHLFGDAVQAYTSNEGRQAVPPPQIVSFPTNVSSRSKTSSQQQPSSPITSLKEQLEARLASEETTEVKDTIQAIFNSLSDAPIPVSSSVTAVTSTSSSKGKAKAETAPSNTASESEDLAVSLARVNSIDSAYRSLVDDFTFPSHLDFTPTSSPASSDTEQSLFARLAYTARNAPVRFHEQSLSGLLSQLDSVESFGDEGLRAKRKEVVGLVEGALEDLEREVEGRWRAKVAKDKAAESAEESTSSEEDSAQLKSVLSEGPAPAPAVAEPAVSDPTSVEEQASSSPISAFTEQPEVVAPLDVKTPSVEAAQVEEDLSSDETSSVSTDTESSTGSFDDVEFDTSTTITDSSTLKVDHDDQLTQTQVDKQDKEKVSDEGSDWSDVEASDTY